MSKNISLLLILLSILLITNISLNVISNEKYIDYNQTKPDFYFRSENVSEYDLYSKLVNLNNIFVKNNLGSMGVIQRDLNEKMDNVEVKVGSDVGSIESAINDFTGRKTTLQNLSTCINEGKDLDNCASYNI